MVIGGGGKLQDISFNAETSPPIDYGIEVPSVNQQQGPYVVYHDLSMVMGKPGSKEFLSWNLDNQTPSVMSGISVPDTMLRTANTFQNGRVFFMKDTKSYTIVDGKLIQLKDFEFRMYWGCAAFVPGDDDTVYLIGGHEHNENTLKKFTYQYKFSTNEYTNLEKDIPGQGIMRHTCVGVEATNGDKVNI